MSFSLKKNSRKARNVYARPREKSAAGLAKPSLRAPGFIRALRGRLGRLASLKSAALLILALTGLAVALAGVGAASLWLYGKAVTSDFFRTTHIDIAGNARLSREMVLRYGGISEGDNSLAVSIADVERNLRDTPWVEEVTVKRLLPDRFVIKIKERMPSFWARKDGKLYYANERGEIIAPVESGNFLSLPVLNVEPGAEDALEYLPRLLRDMQNGALPVESGAVASVTLSPSRGVEIYLEDREMRISIATDDWDGNLARLGAAFGDLARRRELGSVREARAVDGSVWIMRGDRA